MARGQTLEQRKQEHEKAAQEYLASLPLEHFMESTGQANQRRITVESLDLLAEARRDVHVYSELLILYRKRKSDPFGKVVPDNMVVLHAGEIEASSSYNLELVKVTPFWVLEYVSKHNKRKDYDDNFEKYETELKIPYYLLFEPENQEMNLFRRNTRRYVSVTPNERGRCEIPELNIEVALQDNWVRFWYKGDLLPLTPELNKQMKQERRRADREKRRADIEEARANTEAIRANNEATRANNEAARAEAAEARSRRLEERLRRLGYDPDNGSSGEKSA